MHDIHSLARRALSAAAGLLAAVSFSLAAHAQIEADDAPFITVEGARLDLVRIRQGADLSAFNAIYLAPVEISYADEDPNYALDAVERDRLFQTMRDEIAEALAGDGAYEIADAPGPGVLDIRAQLVDVEINRPSFSAAQRGSVYVSSVGEMTLIAVIRDGGTGQNLILVRDEIEDRQHQFMRVTAASYWASVRRAFSIWSGALREALDRARAE